MSLVDHLPGMRRYSDPDERREVIAKLLTAIGSGVPITVAANYSGVGVQTLRRWVQDGARLNAIQAAVDGDPDDDRVADQYERELMSLHERVAKQEASAERHLAKVVWDAAFTNGDVKSAQWLLERRWPDRWARRTELTGANGGPLEIEEGVDRRARALEGLDVLAEKLAESESTLDEGAEVVALGASGDVTDAEMVEG